MTPFEIVMAIVVALVVIWVVVITFWCIKASKKVPQHKGAMECQHSNGPPGVWPPEHLDFP